MDFEYVTPCGEDCRNCNEYRNGACSGCAETDGKCIKMWDNGCYVYACCKEHNAPICGLCREFPCEWLITKGSRNPDIVRHQTALAAAYKEQFGETEKKN